MGINKIIKKDTEKYDTSKASQTGTQNRSKVPFAVAEAYKSIRTNIMFLLPEKKGNVITVSGSEISEGKSTTAINVAIAFSQLGDKVLLIDADMRRSSIHKKLKLDNDTGLSNVLAGFCEFKDAVKSVSPTLDVLTAGQLAPNPSELLGSERFEKLIEQIRKNYSMVIIDTPPINVVSDALVIAPKTDGIILVVREKFTLSDALQSSIEAINFANVKLLGAIMNGVAQKSKGYSYRKYRYMNKYYKYGSKSGYGYGYGGYGYGGYGYSSPRPAGNPNDIKQDGNK